MLVWLISRRRHGVNPLVLDGHQYWAMEGVIMEEATYTAGRASAAGAVAGATLGARRTSTIDIESVPSSDFKTSDGRVSLPGSHFDD